VADLLATLPCPTCGDEVLVGPAGAACCGSRFVVFRDGDIDILPRLTAEDQRLADHLASLPAPVYAPPLGVLASADLYDDVPDSMFWSDRG
jgi:hypothetical protein